MAAETDKGFGSLEKAIRILCLFDAETRERSAQEISNSLNIPLSTTYNYLKVFLRNDILSKDENSGKFRLGWKVFKLGVLAAANVSLLEIAAPYLLSIARRTQETVVLALIDGLDLLCVDTIESIRPVKLTMKRGARLPMHAGAPGKVLLAYNERSFLDEVIQSRGLPKVNRNTITDAKALGRELEVIREQGYSQSDSEVDSGAAALAVPILDYTGRAVASVSLIGSLEAILGRHRAGLVEILKEASEGISEKLGWVRPASLIKQGPESIGK
ncbi:Transcriptional regulator, IclR family (fragment) [uncultured Desulfatiglans sp.]|uniref:Transcriptional regulator, IclR family n=1 Tax=Uncultured Desulfatiglans sp. TaxID=1748965 RepID=A0A653A5H4_UNCDX